jgi:hypothetical protein
VAKYFLAKSGIISWKALDNNNLQCYNKIKII